ncbi:MAG: hypothetical protein AB7K71_01090 [Polyangiaceae bacterium]
MHALLAFLNTHLLADTSMWTAPVFQKDVWTGVMRAVRYLLTFGGAVLLMYEIRARKLRQPVSQSMMKGMAVLFTVLAFGAYFDFGNPNTRYSEYYHRHEFYHYYLGSKYFEELGYGRLYECSAVAEVELGFGAEMPNREIRDLAHHNLIKPVADTEVLKNPGHCKDHFSTKDWEAFKKDVLWFRNSANGGDYWKSMLKDHGYNPPPVWTMEGKFFSNLGVADDGFFKKLAAIDVVLHLGVVLLIYWAFGWRTMMVATVFWGCNAPANFYWTGGAFLRQDWIFFLVASICLARKRKFMLAGWALAWSGLIRVFPAGLFWGYGVVILTTFLSMVFKAGNLKAGWERYRQTRFFREHTRLIAGAALCVAVLVPVSAKVSGGFDSYKAFWKHITLHTGTGLTNHMGVKTMLTHSWDGRMRFTRDNSLDDPFKPWKDGRHERDKKTKPIRYAIALGIALWGVWAMRRTRLLWIGLPMGLVLVMTLTDLTCYYFSMFIIATVLSRIRPGVGVMMMIGSGASQLLLDSYYFVDDKYTAQSWLFFVIGILAMFAVSRPPSMARLKAWIAGKPEPKSPPRDGGATPMPAHGS